MAQWPPKYATDFGPVPKASISPLLNRFGRFPEISPLICDPYATMELNMFDTKTSKRNFYCEIFIVCCNDSISRNWDELYQ